MFENDVIEWLVMRFLALYFPCDFKGHRFEMAEAIYGESFMTEWTKQGLQ